MVAAGVCLLEGIGTADASEAEAEAAGLGWLRKAAELGNPQGQCVVALQEISPAMHAHSTHACPGRDLTALPWHVLSESTITVHQI